LTPPPERQIHPAAPVPRARLPDESGVPVGSVIRFGGGAEKHLSPLTASNSHYAMAMAAQIRNPKEIRDPKADSASSPFNAEAQRFAEVRRE